MRRRGVDTPAERARLPRLATEDDTDEVARLLHDFSVEFDTPTPGVAVLASRLRELLARRDTLAILAGRPAVAVALVTLRPNVWYPGPVALLDELYVVPERRGQGIGTGVMHLLVLETLRRCSVALVEINVDEGDAAAQRFSGRQGFSVTDPVTGEGALCLFRELGA